MAHVLACPRYSIAKLQHVLPKKFIEALEQNQQIAHCCRNPLDGHEIEAFYSSEEVQAKEGTPDIYIIHCTCGRKHRRFCIGLDIQSRPFWEVH